MTKFGAKTERTAPKYGFYDFAVFFYLLHMAVMANLTAYYPDALMSFRMPTYLLAAGLAAAAVGLRIFRQEPIPLKALIFYAAYFSLLLLSVLYSEENVPYVMDIAANGTFVKYCLLFSLLFLMETEPDKRVRALTVAAFAALPVYLLGIYKGALTEGLFNYMTLGYGCAPWWIILTQGIFYYRHIAAKAACLAASVYFALVIAVYGNRGALLLVFVATGVLLAVYLPFKRLLALLPFIMSGYAAAICFLERIISFARAYIPGFNWGESRNMELLSEGIQTYDSGSFTISEGGLFYDSGRFPIWRSCWREILRSPLIGGGVGADRVIAPEHMYAHNIVLELCVSLGVIAGMFIYCWLVYMGWRMAFHCESRAWRALFLPFYIFSMGELLFSDSCYKSGWLMAAVIIYEAYGGQRSGPPLPCRREPLWRR